MELSKAKSADGDSARHRRRRNASFTLIEVVVALAIFASGLIGALALAGSSAKRLDKAVKRWEQQHLLAQAAEFLILNGFSDKSIPDEFLPANRFRVDVQVNDPEDLPEDIQMDDSKWKLKRIVLRLLDEDGAELETLEFDRIVYEEIK